MEMGTSLFDFSPGNRFSTRYERRTEKIVFAHQVNTTGNVVGASKVDEQWIDPRDVFMCTRDPRDFSET
jgi:hypothetical protein